MLRLEQEQVVVTLQRNDFYQVLAHCMGLTREGYDKDHLRQISETLMNYFNTAEEIEEQANGSRALRTQN